MAVYGRPSERAHARAISGWHNAFQTGFMLPNVAPHFSHWPELRHSFPPPPSATSFFLFFFVPPFLFSTLRLSPALPSPVPPRRTPPYRSGPLSLFLCSSFLLIVNVIGNIKSLDRHLYSPGQLALPFYRALCSSPLSEPRSSSPFLHNPSSFPPSFCRPGSPPSRHPVCFSNRGSPGTAFCIRPGPYVYTEMIR